MISSWQSERLISHFELCVCLWYEILSSLILIFVFVISPEVWKGTSLHAFSLCLLHIKSPGPVVSDVCITGLCCHWGFVAGCKGLLAKWVDPIAVSLLCTSDDIILRTILKFFIAKFHTPLNFDFLHAAILWFTLYIAGSNEQPFMCLVRFDAAVTNRTLVFPHIVELDHRIRLSLRE